jgi:hypothetical protein
METLSVIGGIIYFSLRISHGVDIAKFHVSYVFPDSCITYEGPLHILLDQYVREGRRIRCYDLLRRYTNLGGSEIGRLLINAFN